MRGETHIDCTPAERDLIVAETCWQMIPHAAFRRTP